MSLFKIEDFNPNYCQEAFDGKDLKGMTVYSSKTEEKLGNLDNILVDETGHFRYFAIDIGWWIFGKKVLVPVGLCLIDTNDRQLYVANIDSKKEAKSLPKYHDSMVIDYDYEERVKKFYRSPSVEASIPVETSLAVENSLPVETTDNAAIAANTDKQPLVSTNRENYDYEREPSLSEMDRRDRKTIKLYEERLIASKQRHKSGDVSLNKKVETTTAHTEVPLEKERVVIERKTVEDETAVTNNSPDFHQGEVAHLEVYEETANIDKQAFVREEVEIKKEIVRDRVETSAEVRQEKLEIDVEGKPEIKD